MEQYDDTSPPSMTIDGPTEGAPEGEPQATGDEEAGIEIETEAEADGEESPVDRGPVPLQGILPEDIARGIHGFDDLPLHPRILESIQKIGWKEPTPVQSSASPSRAARS